MSTSISQGNPPPLSAQPVDATIARTPKTVSNNLTIDGLGRHPLPTYDPSWSNPHRGPAPKAYWRDPYHTRCDAWDGGSAPPDEARSAAAQKRIRCHEKASLVRSVLLWVPSMAQGYCHLQRHTMSNATSFSDDKLVGLAASMMHDWCG